MQKLILNSVWAVADYLLTSKKNRGNKSYIHDMKRICKSNNIGDRIMRLRNTFNWQISTILEGYKDGKSIYHYKLVKVGKMPEKHNIINKK